MAVSTSERIHLERTAIKKRQLIEGMATGMFMGQAAKEAGRGNYVQQVGTPLRKLVIAPERQRKFLASTGIHSLKRRALTRKTMGRKSLIKRSTLTGPGGRGTVRTMTSPRDRGRVGAQTGGGPSGARVSLGRPHSFTRAREQAKFRSTKAARRGFNYEEQASRNAFLGTRRISDYAPAEMYKSRKPIAYQPY